MPLRVLVFALFTLASGARAEVISLDPVLGEFETTTFEVSCPAAPAGCFTCINDDIRTGDHRLIIALGATFPNLVTTGLAEGTLRPFLRIGGARVPPSLFPCGSRFRFGVRWSDLPLARNCGETPKGVTFQIGPLPERTESGDGSDSFEIPAEGADEIPFTMSVCSQLLYWGAGCNISQSSQHGWDLILPARMQAAPLTAGSNPLIFSGAGLAADVQSPGDGVLTVAKVSADPPGLPPVPHLTGYWDLKTDLAPLSFTAEVTLSFDPATLPPGIAVGGMVIAQYDETAQAWVPRTTDVDPVNNTARTTVQSLSKLVLVESATVGGFESSWGAIKAGF